MKKSEVIILAFFAIGCMAIGYLLLAAISFVFLLDGGGSGDILDSIKNPYVAIPIGILAVSVFFTHKRASEIMFAAR